jgi:hypothetical protein
VSLRVSNSRVGTWRRCHYAHYLKYVEKLQKKFKARPLVFGGVVHEMLEAHANGDDPFEKLAEIEKSQGKMFQSQAEELGELIDDVRDIMTDYFAHWKNVGDFSYTRAKGKSAEFSFEVDAGKGITIIGKLDGIVKTKNKLKWLLENKTGKSIPNEDHRWRNLQSALYVRVIEMLSLSSVDGTCWNFIRSKSPTRPQVLKSGAMSQRGIDTLPTRVKKTLAKHDLHPNDFATMMKFAELNCREYFSRIYSPIKKRVVDSLFADFMSTAEDIRDDPERRDKNINRHCDWCDFRDICSAELRGTDAAFIKAKDFIVRPPHDQEEPDFEG